jgi:hypothetical protein
MRETEQEAESAKSGNEIGKEEGLICGNKQAKKEKIRRKQVKVSGVI